MLSFDVSIMIPDELESSTTNVEFFDRLIVQIRQTAMQCRAMGIPISYTINSKPSAKLTLPDSKAAQSQFKSYTEYLTDQQPDPEDFPHVEEVNGNVLEPEEDFEDVNGNLLDPEESNEAHSNIQTFPDETSTWDENPNGFVKPNWMPKPHFDLLTVLINKHGTMRRVEIANFWNLSIHKTKSELDLMIKQKLIKEVWKYSGYSDGYVIADEGRKSILPKTKIITPKVPQIEDSKSKSLKSFQELKELVSPETTLSTPTKQKFDSPEEFISAVLQAKSPLTDRDFKYDVLTMLRQTLYTNQMEVAYKTALNMCKAKQLLVQAKSSMVHDKSVFFPVDTRLVLEKRRRENNTSRWDFYLLGTEDVTIEEMTDVVTQYAY